MAKKQEDPGPIVNMPCKRGKDQRTAGQACDSKRAYKLSKDGSPQVQFKCVKCGFIWTVPLGGEFKVI